MPNIVREIWENKIPLKYIFYKKEKLIALDIKNSVKIWKKNARNIK